MTALVRFAARDPGGANVLAGFLTRQRPAFDFDIWTLPRATPAFERSGFKCREFSDQFTATGLRACWQENPANILITGTSHYTAFEPLLWEIAAMNGCHSLAVNDSWVNLPARFQHGRPAWIGAVDDAQIEELVAMGFPRERIIVTGHPWLYSVIEKRAAILADAVVPSRQPGVNVLFVSEAIASDVSEGLNAPFGFDEFDSFRVLHEAAKATTRRGTMVNCAIKFHPYENPQTFLDRLKTLPVAPGLNVIPLPFDAKPYPWVLWADLVAGIGSMLLLEAIVLGRPVVSIQPGLLREDTFIAARRGFARTLTQPKDATAVLAQLLEDVEMRDAELKHNQDFLQAFSSDPSHAILCWIQENLPA